MIVKISYINHIPHELRTELVHHSLLNELKADLELHNVELLWIREKHRKIRPDFFGENVIEPRD